MSPDHLCEFCRLPVLDGQPAHGITGNHWECQQTLVKKFERLTGSQLPSLENCRPYDPTSPLIAVRANGGHLAHWKREGTDKALCGHVPKNSPGTRMAQRGYWLRLGDLPAGAKRTFCRECASEMERISSAKA